MWSEDYAAVPVDQKQRPNQDCSIPQILGDRRTRPTSRRWVQDPQKNTTETKSMTGGVTVQHSTLSRFHNINAGKGGQNA